MSSWFVYMVMCKDDTIYIGITNDIKERIIKHNSGKGAKYTRARTPVALKAFWEFPNKSEASKEEYSLKQLRREQKLAMIESFPIARLKKISK